MVPASIQWEIASHCNYRCQHCYRLDSSWERRNQEGELLDEAMFKIAEIIANNHLFFATFTGGEPLCRRQLLLEMARYLYKAGVILSLNTNLVLLDEKTLANLKVHRMLISCPAGEKEIYREITGGDLRVFEAKLKMVITAGVDFTINLVASKLNFHLIRPTAIYLAQLGVKSFAITPASLNAGCPNFDLLLSQSEIVIALNDLIWAHEKLGFSVDVMEAIPTCVIPPRAFELCLPFVYRSCRAGQRNGTIAVNGDIRPCSHNPEIFGNILKEDISQIWERLQGWRKKIGNPHLDCLHCDVFSYCHGGCGIDINACQDFLAGKHPYMTGQTYGLKLKPKPISFGPEVVVRPGPTFQSRKEDAGWLVASGSSRNILEVNDSLFRFLQATRGQSPLTLAALAQKFGATFDNPDYQRVMQILMRKQFFVLEK